MLHRGPSCPPWSAAVAAGTDLPSTAAQPGQAMTSLTLDRLFSAIDDTDLPPDARNIRVRRVRDDSRDVEPGDLFVAVRGARADGVEHIAEAVARGAVAVV